MGRDSKALPGGKTTIENVLATALAHGFADETLEHVTGEERKFSNGLVDVWLHEIRRSTNGGWGFVSAGWGLEVRGVRHPVTYQSIARARRFMLGADAVKRVAAVKAAFAHASKVSTIKAGLIREEQEREKNEQEIQREAAPIIASVTRQLRPIGGSCNFKGGELLEFRVRVARPADVRAALRELVTALDRALVGRR